MGKMYVDFYGETNYINKTTNDKAFLNFKLRKWGDKNIYEADGYILDAKGNQIFLLEGKWNSYLNLINCENQ